MLILGPFALEMHRRFTSRNGIPVSTAEKHADQDASIAAEMISQSARLQHATPHGAQNGTGIAPSMSDRDHPGILMNRHRHLEIRYHFKRTQHIFIRADSHLTDTDACYYACLHAEVGLRYEMDGDQHDIGALREHAQECGVT